MLKFSPFPTIYKEMSYTNNCISEYLGCQIFKSVGIPVQETLLGTYTSKAKEKIVVACKDFTSQKSAGVRISQYECERKPMARMKQRPMNIRRRTSCGGWSARAARERMEQFIR